MPNELKHHGVAGQRWGVQNGPPYPLGSDVSTGSRLKIVTKKRQSGDAETAKKIAKSTVRVVKKAAVGTAKGTVKTVKVINKARKDSAVAKRKKEVDYLINKASRKEILEKLDTLTPIERNQAIQRLNAEQAIKGTGKQGKSLGDVAKGAINSTDDVVKLVNAAVKGYETYKDIADATYNATGGKYGKKYSPDFGNKEQVRDYIQKLASNPGRDPSATIKKAQTANKFASELQEAIDRANGVTKKGGVSKGEAEDIVISVLKEKGLI